LVSLKEYLRMASETPGATKEPYMEPQGRKTRSHHGAKTGATGEKDQEPRRSQI
jgi:hypothetical protein